MFLWRCQSNSFLSFLCRVFGMLSWRCRIEFSPSNIHDNDVIASDGWNHMKIYQDVNRSGERRHLGPRWSLFFAVAQHAWIFLKYNENAATICHSFLVKCRFRLCLTQSTKKKLKLVYLKMLVGTLTEICLRAEMEINVRLIGNFVTFTKLQGKRLRTQTIVVVMLEQAWKK